jgi:hypothetical protein
MKQVKRNRLIVAFEFLRCGLGFHVWTGWQFTFNKNPERCSTKTRTCKICGYSQVRSTL